MYIERNELKIKIHTHKILVYIAIGNSNSHGNKVEKIEHTSWFYFNKHTETPCIMFYNGIFHVNKVIFWFSFYLFISLQSFYSSQSGRLLVFQFGYFFFSSQLLMYHHNQIFHRDIYLHTFKMAAL